ncbi:MAG: ribosome maturation factor RimM [Prolixibacteraceae bacterium]
MTPFIKDDFLPIGFILKPHGLKGGMILEIEDGYEEVVEDSEFLLVEVEGGLVPFFVTEDGINFRSPTSLSLSFDGYDSVEKLRPFCGCKIFIHKDIEIDQNNNEELNELIGVTVFDKERGKLGKILRVDDFSGNVVLTIGYAGREVLIPLSEQIIIKLDESNKELHVDCPEGLIDLNIV